MATTTTKKMKIGFIHNAFPVLSETFISKEMRGLKELGLDLEIYSLFRPQNGRQDSSRNVGSNVHYVVQNLTLWTLISAHLYFLILTPVRYLKIFTFAQRSRQVRLGILKTFLALKGKDTIDKNRRQDLVLHFILAVPLARTIKKQKITFINSHFADAAASFAMLCARLLDIPFGITAHAYDIFTPQFNLREKLTYATFMLTCTNYNKKSLLEQHPDFVADKIHVFYHGIETDKFVRQVQQNNEKPEILAVGRLTAKKGFDVLLNACAEIQKNGVEFKCRIIGDGEEKEHLLDLTSMLELNDCVEFVGAVPSADIKQFYERADIFALPCVIDKDGNRDGIPNVIAEAMAMELPVVSSHISGIPELVIHQETGILLEPHDVTGVARTVETLIKQPDKRREMGKKGRNRVLSIFDSRVCLENLYTFYINELCNGG